MSPEPGALEVSLGGLVWPPVVVGPQLQWIHWQVRLVPGPLVVRAWPPLLQAFGVVGYMAQLHCCRHIVVCWCRLRPPTGCGGARVDLKGCLSGWVLRDMPDVG